MARARRTASTAAAAQPTDSAEQSQRRDVIIRHLIGQMNKNIGRLAAAPGRRMAAVPATTPEAAAAVAAMPRAATPLKAELISRPRTLHDLWAEWQVGGGGRKPAKDFNSGERGAVRSKYSFRKPFWEKGVGDDPGGTHGAGGV